MRTFRQFIEEAPPNPDNTSTHNDSRVFDNESDISPEERAVADIGNTYTVHAPLPLPNGVTANPPTEVSIRPIGDDLYKIKVLTTNRQKLKTKSGHDHQDSVENIEFIKDGKFLDWLKMHSLEAAIGGAMSANPMGGTPPIPPMGVM